MMSKEGTRSTHDHDGKRIMIMMIMMVVKNVCVLENETSSLHSCFNVNIYIYIDTQI